MAGGRAGNRLFAAVPLDAGPNTTPPSGSGVQSIKACDNSGLEDEKPLCGVDVNVYEAPSADFGGESGDVCRYTIECAPPL